MCRPYGALNLNSACPTADAVGYDYVATNVASNPLRKSFLSISPRWSCKRIELRTQPTFVKFALFVR